MTKNPRIAQPKTAPTDYARAKELRRNASFIEQVFWCELRTAAKPRGLRFRRQHPIHPYIADFVCLNPRMVIEIDGSSHDLRQARDKRRDEYLKNLGYDVMRFTNEEVMQNRDGVLLAVFQRIAEIS